MEKKPKSEKKITIAVAISPELLKILDIFNDNLIKHGEELKQNPTHQCEN